MPRPSFVDGSVDGEWVQREYSHALMGTSALLCVMCT